MTSGIVEIKNEKDYNIVSNRISELLCLNPTSGTPEYEELKYISDLMIAYEDIYYPIPDPSNEDEVTRYCELDAFINFMDSQPWCQRWYVDDSGDNYCFVVCTSTPVSDLDHLDLPNMLPNNEILIKYELV